ncbi:MAG: polyprenyl synthetase family protein [Thermincola sp.]|nr:polyprenyl synthetase family protein [Thermincola sp.]MDT3702773.1 polyprenyl synthetase family protein [Thermincola sp.]
MNRLEIFNTIRTDLKYVEKELQKIVKTPDPLLTETSAHLLNAGGKRLRPAFALLAGKTCKYKPEKLIPLAMALELIHMASLVHDDVIDDSYTRRGIPTVKANWGDQISIYTGTYLFAQSLILIAECDNPVVSRILADISVKMCEGEIQQIVSCFDPNQTLKDYFFRIKRKTALLISASCELGAVACGAPDFQVKALERFGYYLGMAFQITDDILDLTANQQVLGKPVGSDLRQGIVTLPVIFAFNLSPDRERLAEIIRKSNKKEGEVLETIEIIKNCGAIEKSFTVSNWYLAKAKKQLSLVPPSAATDSLAMIADFIGKRKF